MKYYITKEATPHGAISWSHDGNDDQYCEAGEVVTLDWQPSAGWGLQEAHYTDSNNAVTAIDLTPVVINGKKVVQFTMPASDIVIGGTFKRFVVQDWTGVGQKGEAMMVGDNGEPIPNNKVTMSADGDVTADGDVAAGGKVTAGTDVAAGGNVTAEGDVTAKNLNAGKNVTVGKNVTASENVTGKVLAAEGYLRLKDTATSVYYKVEVTNGVLEVNPL